jgi:glucosamine 6-phosphate synthetase-like amidotransferase/phosphosugar isomerase protein
MFQTSNLLSPFSTTIQLSGDSYIITYKKDEYMGNVIYRKYNNRGTNKPIRQDVYMIISSDMGDVIEYINKISPLTDGDITNINKIIRDDSLTRLTEYLTSVPLRNFVKQD